MKEDFNQAKDYAKDSFRLMALTVVFGMACSGALASGDHYVAIGTGIAGLTSLALGLRSYTKFLDAADKVESKMPSSTPPDPG